MNTNDLEIAHLQKTLQHLDVERCKQLASWLAEFIQSLEADGEFYNLPLQQLHLTSRTFNILQCNKITTVGQLIKRAADWHSIKQLKGAGSASATAAGLVPFAIGTETWGSFISPSHRCGATGLRPTFGSVSGAGGMVLAWSLDKPGPICRSAEDAAIVFYYMKGRDDKDASSVNRAFNYTGKADLKKLRIAYAANYFNKLGPQSMQAGALKTFHELGARLQEVQFPDSTVYPYNMIGIVISAEAAAAFDELTRSNRDDLIRRQDKNFWPNTFRMARFIPAVEYINTNRHRSVLIEKVNAFMKNYDVVIMPSFVDNQMAITNLTGHPTLVLPIGFTTDTHLPNSITLIGNLYDEATIPAVAKAFQDATSHNKQHPDKFKN